MLVLDNGSKKENVGEIGCLRSVAKRTILRAQLDAFSDQRLERVKRLVHRPRHCPQQNDPKIGVVERELVVAGNRDEDFAAAYLGCPHDRPVLAVEIFDLWRRV